MGKGNGKLKQPDRPTGIGGTDAIRITEGTWKDLWLEKIGKVERKDLSGVLPVQLGIFTEEFNRRWYQEVTKERVVNIGNIFTHPQYDYIYGSLDGVAKGKVFEAKHVNAFVKDQNIIDKYYPQVQHYMMVTGFSKAVLSVLRGNLGYNIFTIERDKPFQRKLEIACHLFWFHVMNNIEPPEYIDFDLMEKINNEDDIERHFGTEISSDGWLQGKLN
jgi:predicted phage-related endonuclease|tara:strand:- start:357 stop:1007 length:651 start_codon:yes stop_codon:yes gene_type:complete